MNKNNNYQEAINELYKQRSERYKVHHKHKDWNKEIIEYDKVGYSLSILQELVDENKQLTFEECIKEWEERGWEWARTTTMIYISHLAKKKSLGITSNNIVKLIGLDLQELELLTKTLKALEIEYENERN